MRRFAAIVLACAATAVACGSPPSYPEEIAAHRAEIDAFMRGDSQSPIPPGQRAAFQPLPYYPIDEQYRVPAALRVARGDEIIEMSTSTGKPRRMRRIGTLAFNFVANSRQLEASISIPIVDVTMLIVSVAAAVIFFAEPLTAKKLLGFALLVAGIVVLKPE